MLQIARQKRIPGLYEHALGFEVSKRLLDDAFRATYGLGLDDIFANTDVAIVTYRWAFRDLIHEVTGVAWALNQSDIVHADPGATEDKFVFDMSRDEFENEFGKAYREPGYSRASSARWATWCRMSARSSVWRTSPCRRASGNGSVPPSRTRQNAISPRSGACAGIALRWPTRRSTPASPLGPAPIGWRTKHMPRWRRSSRIATRLVSPPAFRADILDFHEQGRLAGMDGSDALREALGQLGATCATP